MEHCTPEIWYPSVLQAIVSTVWYSTALKFELFLSVWRCFFYRYHLVTATSGCRCGQTLLSWCLHIQHIFVFGFQSSMWEVFRTNLFDLWLCSPVSSYGHVGKLPPFMGLKRNMVVRLSSGDGPFTLAWRSMHFLSVLQILYAYIETS